MPITLKVGGGPADATSQNLLTSPTARGPGPGATQNVFKNSAIEKGMASYVYPSQANDPVIHATYTNNRDFHSGAALTLP